MPILDIEAVGELDRPTNKAFTQALANSAAIALGTRDNAKTWVKFRLLNEEHYAENHSAASGPKPVFVTVLLAEMPVGDEKLWVTKKLAEAVSGVTGRPRENVHVIFQSSGTGRVSFGRDLFTSSEN